MTRLSLISHVGRDAIVKLSRASPNRPPRWRAKVMWKHSKTFVHVLVHAGLTHRICSLVFILQGKGPATGNLCSLITKMFTTSVSDCDSDVLDGNRPLNFTQRRLVTPNCGPDSKGSIVSV